MKDRRGGRYRFEDFPPPVTNATTVTLLAALRPSYDRQTWTKTALPPAQFGMLAADPLPHEIKEFPFLPVTFNIQ
jgi:hypothetical protein